MFGGGAMGIEVKLTDNTGLYLNALQSQIEAAPEPVGQQAETHALFEKSIDKHCRGRYNKSNK